MLPTTNTPQPTVPAAKGETEPAFDVTTGPADPLEPIGPERLRALREAIRDGTYPTEADVLGGIQRMLRWE